MRAEIYDTKEEEFAGRFLEKQKPTEVLLHIIDTRILGIRLSVLPAHPIRKKDVIHNFRRARDLIFTRILDAENFEKFRR